MVLIALRRTRLRWRASSMPRRMCCKAFLARMNTTADTEKSVELVSFQQSRNCLNALRSAPRTATSRSAASCSANILEARSSTRARSAATRSASDPRAPLDSVYRVSRSRARSALRLENEPESEPELSRRNEFSRRIEFSENDPGGDVGLSGRTSSSFALAAGDSKTADRDLGCW